MMNSDATTSGVGFIGGGRIVRVILGGWRRAGFSPGEIVISDPDPGALSRIEALDLEAKAIRDGNSQAAAQPFLFLAVHPPVIRTLGPELSPVLGSNTVIISLAPKLTIAALSDLFGGFARIVRAIPNAPSIVGAGYNPVTFAEELPTADRSSVIDLLAPLGQSPEVPEPELEAYAILTATGPTYLWPQLYQLVGLSTEFGLPPDASLDGLEAMLNGAIAAMRAGFGLEEAMGLVSGRPLASLEPVITEGYEQKLRKVYEAIKTGP